MTHCAGCGLDHIKSRLMTDAVSTLPGVTNAKHQIATRRAEFGGGAGKQARDSPAREVQTLLMKVAHLSKAETQRPNSERVISAIVVQPAPPMSVCRSTTPDSGL